MKKAELSSEKDAKIAAAILIKRGGDAFALGAALLYENISIPSWIPYRETSCEITDFDRLLFNTHWG